MWAPPSYTAAVRTPPLILLTLLALIAACSREDVEGKERERRRAGVLAQMRQRKADYHQLLEQVTRLEHEQREAAMALPTQAELPALFARLQEVAQEREIRLIEWRRENERMMDDLVEVGISLELRGAFGNLIGWIEGVRRGGRVVVVRELTITGRWSEGLEPVTAQLRLATHRLGGEPATPVIVPAELDKEFAGDPEIRNLYESTRDLERLQAAAEQIRARKERIDAIRTKDADAVALLTQLMGAPDVWLESLALVDGAFTIAGGAAQSLDVVSFMKKLQSSGAVRDLELTAEQEVTDPSMKHPFRRFHLAGKLAPPAR